MGVFRRPAAFLKPEAEIRRKPEIRNPKSEGQDRIPATGKNVLSVLQKTRGRREWEALCRHTRRAGGAGTSGFGFRISFGFRPSDFGFDLSARAIIGDCRRAPAQPEPGDSC